VAGRAVLRHKRKDADGIAVSHQPVRCQLEGAAAANAMHRHARIKHSPSLSFVVARVSMVTKLLCLPIMQRGLTLSSLHYH